MYMINGRQVNSNVFLAFGPYQSPGMQRLTAMKAMVSFIPTGQGKNRNQRCKTSKNIYGTRKKCHVRPTREGGGNRLNDPDPDDNGDNRNTMNEKKLLDTTEGRVLLAGIFMTGLLILFIIYYLFAEPERARALTLTFFAHAMGGRAAGVGICILYGLNFFWSVFYNLYIEILMVFITYALFVFSLNHHIKAQWAINFANNLMIKAGKHKNKIHRFGWIGLFLFVMVPLPVTGPVVGSIIGYLLKMNIWRNMSAVILGTFAAIVTWVLGFEFLQQYMHMIQYLIVAIIVVVIFFNIRTLKGFFSSPKDS